MNHKLTRPPTELPMCGGDRALQPLVRDEEYVTCAPCRLLVEADVQKITVTIHRRGGRRIRHFITGSQIDAMISDAGSLGRVIRSIALDEPGVTTEESVLPARQTRPTNIDRLDWVRGHLARVQRYGVTPAERREILRLLNLIMTSASTPRVSAFGSHTCRRSSRSHVTSIPRGTRTKRRR